MFEPPTSVIALVLVVVMALDRVFDKFPPTGSSLVVPVLVGNEDEEVGVVGLLVLERGGGSLTVEEGGGEAVAVDEDAMVAVKLRGNPVPVTDVGGVLEAGVFVEEDGRLLLGERVGRLLLGELKEELVAIDELTITELEVEKVEEVEEVEEGSSGDDAEVEDVMLRNKMGKWRPTSNTNTYDEKVVEDDVGLLLLLLLWGSVGRVGVEDDWAEDGGEVDMGMVRDGETS